MPHAPSTTSWSPSPVCTGEDYRPHTPWSSPACGGGGPKGRRGRAVAPVFAFVFALLFAGLAHAALTFPPLTGRVVDNAHVLTPQVQQDLTGKLAALEQQTGRQLVVVTVPSLQGDAIEDYGYQLGRTWGIGQKGQNNGVLFIVAPAEHKVRVEVGYGLEPVLTDALSSIILQRAVLPKFRSGDIQGGVADGTGALIQQLSLPDAEAKARVAQAQSAPPKAHVTPGSIIGLLILFWVLASFLGALGRRGGRGGSAWWLLPLLLSSSSNRGWGGGGGGSWGGGGGGGFSGGGGSFGGGGASGGW